MTFIGAVQRLCAIYNEGGRDAAYLRQCPLGQSIFWQFDKSLQVEISRLLRLSMSKIFLFSVSHCLYRHNRNPITAAREGAFSSLRDITQ